MTNRPLLLLGLAVLVALIVSPGAAAAQSTGPAGGSESWDTAARTAIERMGQRMRPAGISIGANWVMEGFQNFMGGKRSNSPVAASTLDVNLAFSTQPALGIRGGEFYVDIEDHAGRNPSQVLVGDVQVFDKLNYSPYLQIFELWYQQRLFDDRLRIKVGKVDANTEFSVITDGLEFISSSTQVSPTVFVFPTTPDPMPSVDIFFTPHDPLYASFGAFYSNSASRYLDITGTPYAIQPTRNGAFLIGETGLVWRMIPVLGASGDFRVGAWGQTGTYQRFDGTTQAGTDGVYAILDQTLLKPPSGGERIPGLAMFLEYGQTDPNVTAVYQHVGGGLVANGSWWGRPRDDVGLSPQLARMSYRMKSPESYELAIETFYNLSVAPHFAVQPDVQYIVNPGGEYPDALVGTMRLKVRL